MRHWIVNASLNRKNGFEVFLRAYWEESIPLKFRLSIGTFKQHIIEILLYQAT